MNEYTREQISAICEDEDNANFIKIRYGAGETGWAIDLGDGHAIIANTPLEPRLCWRDVVKLEVGPGSWPLAGPVVFRYYARKTGVTYPAATEEMTKANWRKIIEACQPHDIHVEGHVAGMCAVSHHEDTDLAGILGHIEGIELCSDWQEQDTEAN